MNIASSFFKIMRIKRYKLLKNSVDVTSDFKHYSWSMGATCYSDLDSIEELCHIHTNTGPV